MNILYFGKVCEENVFKEKEKKQQPFFVAQYMYEKALCDEFIKNKNIDLEIVSIYQTEYFPKDIMFFNKRSKEGYKVKLKYLKFINLPYLRELSYFISTCFCILNWWARNREEKNNKCIYSSCHFPPVSLAIVIMGKVLSIKKIVTFTDLSLFTFSSERINKMKAYKKVLMTPYVGLVNKLQKSYDGYILFSKTMNDVVNPYNKPYCVVEGMYNGGQLNFDTKAVKQHAIAHAGTLNEEVGIKKILDVFDLIEDQEVELYLIGKGDMTKEIENRSKTNKSIKYLGFMPKGEVFEYLKSAKLLVNLRNPSDIYTRYSFPSKIFEYMVSGTPVLTTKLEGIPKEYYDYLYTVNSYDSEVIKDKIIEIITKSEDELFEFGIKAREFVLKEKNSKKQSEKIVAMINNLLKLSPSSF